MKLLVRSRKLTLIQEPGKTLKYSQNKTCLKFKKTDMSESKILPSRNFVTMKKQKTKKCQKVTEENDINDNIISYVITVVQV